MMISLLQRPGFRVAITSALSVLANGLTAQTPSKALTLPILRPTAITPIAEFRDSGRGDLPGLTVSSSSPNGRLIVYGTGRADLTLYNTITHARTVLVTGPVHGGSWGPKGDMYVIQTHPGPLLYQGKELSRQPSIYTISIDPTSGEVFGPPHLVTPTPVNHGVFLSPDEKTIAFAQPYGWYVSTLSVVPTAGGSPRVVATGIEVARISWSADGSFLFYTAFSNASSRSLIRYKIPLSGGTPVPIGESELSIVDGKAYPQSKEFANGVRTLMAPIRSSPGESLGSLQDNFTGGSAALYSYPADLETEQLNRTCRADMLATRRVSPRGLQVININEQTSKRLIDTTAEVLGDPQWLPRNRLASFMRSGSRFVLLIQNADGNESRRFDLSRFGGYSAPTLRISPDGRYAAFSGEDGGFQTIELVNVTSGQQRAIVAVPGEFGDGSSPEGMGIGDFAWRDDSKALRYIRDNETGEPSAHEVTISGADRLLLRLPQFIYGFGTAASFPAGGHAELIEYGGNPSPNGIGWATTLVPVNGDLPRLVYAGGNRGGPLSPDGRTIALPVGSPQGEGVTIFLAQATSWAEPRTLSLPFVAMRPLQWHPDGRLLVLGHEAKDRSLNIYSVPIDGRAPSVFAKLGSALAQPSWSISPDGDFLAFTTSATETVTLFRVAYDLSPIRASRAPCP